MMVADEGGLIKEVKIGEKEVVDSTTYLIPALTSKLEVVPSENKRVVILFSEETKDKTVRYTGGADESGMVYTIKLINFSNVLGEGVMEQIPFFKRNDTQYYISLWVNTNADKSRVLTLTLTKG